MPFYAVRPEVMDMGNDYLDQAKCQVLDISPPVGPYQRDHFRGGHAGSVTSSGIIFIILTLSLIEAKEI